MNNKDIMKQIFFVIILFVLILFNGCANVKKDLNIAIDENTEASLYKFMHKHCFGKDIKEECLLADNKLWGIVSTSNNFAGYCNYLNNTFNQSKMLDTAHKIDELYWDKAKIGDTILDYKKYILRNYSHNLLYNNESCLPHIYSYHNSDKFVQNFIHINKINIVKKENIQSAFNEIDKKMWEKIDDITKNESWTYKQYLNHDYKFNLKDKTKFIFQINQASNKNNFQYDGRYPFTLKKWKPNYINKKKSASEIGTGVMVINKGKISIDTSTAKFKKPDSHSDTLWKTITGKVSDKGTISAKMNIDIFWGNKFSKAWGSQDGRISGDFNKLEIRRNGEFSFLTINDLFSIQKKNNVNAKNEKQLFFAVKHDPRSFEEMGKENLSDNKFDEYLDKNNIVHKYTLNAKKIFDEKLWQKALSKNTVEGYQHYLDNLDYEKKQYAAEARQKILSLNDPELWKEALTENTVEGYQHYLDNLDYEKKQYAAEAKQKILSLNQGKLWDQALAESTVVGYMSYIKQFPEGEHVDEAKTRLDKELWTKAQSKNTLEGYQEYLDEQSNLSKSFADDAEKIIPIIQDQQLWAKAQKINSFLGYQEYLNNQNNQLKKFAAEAENGIKEKSCTRDGDRQLWKKAQSQKTLEGYQFYLDVKCDKYKKKFNKAAKKNIAKIETANKKWADALDENTIEGYENYLADTSIKDKKHAKEAQQKIMALNDHKQWEEALSKNTLVSYNKYINDNPNGLYVEESKLKLAELKAQLDEKLWQQASAENTLNSYRKYIKDNPSGLHIGEAKTQIDNFDEDLWDQAIAESTLESSQNYLKQMPEGKHAGEAKSIIDEELWDQAIAESTVKSYQNYLRQMPEGKHAGEAKSIIDEELWDLVMAEGTLESYQNYLRLMPEGKHVDEAHSELEGNLDNGFMDLKFGLNENQVEQIFKNKKCVHLKSMSSENCYKLFNQPVTVLAFYEEKRLNKIHIIKENCSSELKNKLIYLYKNKYGFSYSDYTKTKNYGTILPIWFGDGNIMFIYSHGTKKGNQCFISITEEINNGYKNNKNPWFLQRGQIAMGAALYNCNSIPLFKKIYPLTGDIPTRCAEYDDPKLITRHMNNYAKSIKDFCSNAGYGTRDHVLDQFVDLYKIGVQAGYFERSSEITSCHLEEDYYFLGFRDKYGANRELSLYFRDGIISFTFGDGIFLCYNYKSAKQFRDTDSNQPCF